MQQLANKNTDAMSKKLDRVLTMKPTQRVVRLREAYLNGSQRGDIWYARISTRVMKATEGEPMVTRKAKVFAAVAMEVPVYIAPDELFTGYIATMPKSEFLSTMFAMDLENSLESMRSASIITDEEEKELREEILPYWRGLRGKYEKNSYGTAYLRYPRKLKDLVYIDPDEYPGRKANVIVPGGIGLVAHNSPDYSKVLRLGFLGMKKEAEDRLARLDLRDPDDLKKLPFVEGAIIASEAASGVGKRFAEKAREMAGEEEDAERKAELLQIAEVCDWVPANPARTFHEALQSIWLAHILHHWETGVADAVSPGRADQYFYPYYEKDIKEGRITKEKAQELLDCWVLKFGTSLHLHPPAEPGASAYHADMPKASRDTINHHIDVGGLTPDGHDATNELSYMFIEAMMHTRLTNPPLGIRVSSKTSDTLLIKACQLLSLGTGHPAFYNDDNLVPNLLERAKHGPWPVTLEQARMATLCGCFDPEITGMESGHVNAGYVNLPAALEFVLTNGWNRFHRKKMGMETGDPGRFKSFEELLEAYNKQVVWLLDNHMLAVNINDIVTAERDPTVFQSVLIGDCIEKGMSKEEGGARFNYRGIHMVGSNDVADSLTAIRKLVFEDKKITMDQLCEALDKNFQGYDDLRQMLLEAPKFGNDIDYADEQGSWVVHQFVDRVAKYRNPRGGYSYGQQRPLMNYLLLGQVVGALPSGRLAGEPLADGIGPTKGSDVNGITAVLKSAGKINNMEVGGGHTLNLRLDSAVFEDDMGIKRVADLIRVVIDEKIFQVQFNVVSSDTLRAAQREPDKYKDLVVKVAGWNAFFVDLTKPLQDGIITRTEHEL
jgi:formate C-acetyltransferase